MFCITLLVHFFYVHAFIVVDCSCNSSPIKLPYNTTSVVASKVPLQLF